jgi:uncharacterized protein YprB with RNaseH-like and TPR domain
MSRKNWTEEEIQKLVENYPLLGYKVISMFPDRTKSSVLRKADWMSLKDKKGLFKATKTDVVGYLDIEASQLDADFGIMYSWVIKYQGQNKYEMGIVTRQEILDGVLDKRVCEDLVTALKKFTLVYTYYGTGFDIPFIRTRCLMNGVKFVTRGEVEHRDAYYLARRCLKLHRNSLDNVCATLGIKGKTHLEGRYWILANSGNPEALAYILDHNKADTVILEKVHEVLAEFEAPKMRWV